MTDETKISYEELFNIATSRGNLIKKYQQKLQVAEKQNERLERRLKLAVDGNIPLMAKVVATKKGLLRLSDLIDIAQCQLPDNAAKERGILLAALKISQETLDIINPSHEK